MSAAAADELRRAEDLEFIATIRRGDRQELELLRVNLSFGGPLWMVIAVERRIARLKTRTETQAEREES
jgi:hypothetical protein